MHKLCLFLITLFISLKSFSENINYYNEFEKNIAKAQFEIEKNPKDAAYDFLKSLEKLGKAFANDQVVMDESNKVIVKAVLESAPAFAKKLYPNIPDKDYEEYKLRQYIIISDIGELDLTDKIMDKVMYLENKYNDNPWLYLQAYFEIYHLSNYENNNILNKIREYSERIESISDVYKAYFYMIGVTEVYANSGYNKTDPLVKNFFNSKGGSNSLIKFQDNMIAALNIKYIGMVAEQNRNKNAEKIFLNKGLSGNRGNLGYEYVYQTNDGRQVSVYVDGDYISVYGAGSYVTTTQKMTPEVAAKKALGIN